MSAKEWSDEALRSAYQAMAEEAGGEGGPEAGRVWEALGGSSSEVERRRVVDEIARLPGSAWLWRLAHEMQKDEEGAAPRDAREVARRPRSSAARRVARYGALAAAAVLLAVGTWIARPAPPDVPEYRAFDPEPIRSHVPRDRALGRDRVILRWSPVAEGVRYDVRVMTESLVEIASARNLVVPEFALPPSGLRDLVPGARILWQVTARLPSGDEARSQTFTATIE